MATLTTAVVGFTGYGDGVGVGSKKMGGGKIGETLLFLLAQPTKKRTSVEMITIDFFIS
jgi:hypothetical protein